MTHRPDHPTSFNHASARGRNTLSALSPICVRNKWPMVTISFHLFLVIPQTISSYGS
jgi:hypothetical protein